MLSIQPPHLFQQLCSNATCVLFPVPKISAKVKEKQTQKNETAVFASDVTCNTFRNTHSCGNTDLFSVTGPMARLSNPKTPAVGVYATPSRVALQRYT